MAARLWLAGNGESGRCTQRQQRQRLSVYDDEVVKVLVKLWELLNYLCGKRLVAIMPELIDKLEQFGELRCSHPKERGAVPHQCFQCRSLTQAERRKHQCEARSHTKPGTLLKHQIPIRTFAEWDNNSPALRDRFGSPRRRPGAGGFLSNP